MVIMMRPKGIGKGRTINPATINIAPDTWCTIGNIAAKLLPKQEPRLITAYAPAKMKQCTVFYLSFLPLIVKGNGENTVNLRRSYFCDVTASLSMRPFRAIATHGKLWFGEVGKAHVL